MAVNKVEINGEVQLDLTQDTVTPETLLSGTTAHNAAGEEITGSMGSIKTYTATIGTTWTEDSNTGVKTQNVAIPGVTVNSTVFIDHAYTGSGTSDDYAAFVEAENQFLTYVTNGCQAPYNGGVKFMIFGDAPTVSIPIDVVVM